MINLGLSNHTLNWQRLKEIVKGCFFLGSALKRRFIHMASTTKELREFQKYYTSDDEGRSGNDFPSSQSSEDYFINCK